MFKKNESYEVKKALLNLIKKEGTFTLRPLNYALVNSHQRDFNGSVSETLHEDIENGLTWKTPTDQFAITFADVNGNGIITHRFNGNGSIKTTDPEMKPEWLKKDGYKIIGKYICKEDKDGLYNRIPSERNDQACEKMFDQFMNKLGYDEGDYIENIEDAIAEGKTINATVKAEEYEGKPIYKISSWSFVEQLEELEEVTSGGELADDDFVKQ